ncbi:hypothetical protein NLJ89_g4612 [Agrocybe chaxingu]|uniref:Uncharacterized protein n=1 Tax=Agrocybe chaxingu TaxID=84603 RepID=A0A9W8K2K9_9AGAR|nr:hypothetical protein NLJ89_g4612 [Agrocybe chaxingu]
MSTSLAIPTDSDFTFLPPQLFSEGFNFEEWQLSNENEFGPFFSEYFGQEPVAQGPALPNGFEVAQINNHDNVLSLFTADDDIRPPARYTSSQPPIAAPSLPETEYDHTTTSPPMGMGLQDNVSSDIYFPGTGSVTADNSFASTTTYPLELFPSSSFTFHVEQPLYPSAHHYPVQPPTTTSNSATYIGCNTPTEYHVGTAQAGTYGSFPSSSSHCSDPASTQSSLYDRVALEAAQPTASGSNPHSALEQAHPRTEDDNATESHSSLPRSAGGCDRRALHRHRHRHFHLPLPQDPRPPSPSRLTTRLPPPRPGPSAQPSANYVRLPDGRYRCRICTGKAAFADTEKDIVRHLETAKAHNPQRILCKDTIYRCPCGKSRLLGKRKDSHKRHVRTYIVAERREAIEAQDQERLSKVDAYEARLRSEKLL